VPRQRGSRLPTPRRAHPAPPARGARDSVALGGGGQAPTRHGCPGSHSRAAHPNRDPAGASGSRHRAAQPGPFPTTPCAKPNRAQELPRRPRSPASPACPVPRARPGALVDAAPGSGPPSCPNAAPHPKPSPGGGLTGRRARRGTADGTRAHAGSEHSPRREAGQRFLSRLPHGPLAAKGSMKTTHPKPGPPERPPSPPHGTSSRLSTGTGRRGHSIRDVILTAGWHRYAAEPGTQRATAWRPSPRAGPGPDGGRGRAGTTAPGGSSSGVREGSGPSAERPGAATPRCPSRPAQLPQHPDTAAQTKPAREGERALAEGAAAGSASPTQRSGSGILSRKQQRKRPTKLRIHCWVPGSLLETAQKPQGMELYPTLGGGTAGLSGQRELRLLHSRRPPRAKAPGHPGTP